MAYARQRGDVELVSVDSMQVYRGMDIGTAKPTRAERAEVPHHLTDIVDPSDEYSVASFRLACREAIDGVELRGHRAVLVGGTALYLHAVVDDLELPGRYPEARFALEAEPDTVSLHRRLRELDPIAATRMEPTNRRRVVRALEVTIGSGRPFSSFGPGLSAYPETSFVLVGLRVPREQLDARIAGRFEQQMADGLLDEVRALRDQPQGLSRTARQALGYKELLAHLDGLCPLDEAVERAITRTRQFARRQDRWLRRDPRIVWVDGSDGHNVLADLERMLGD
jgi:tRNA dimethylallyltransferase